MPMSRAGFAALLVQDINRVIFDVGQERPAEYSMYFNVRNMDTNPQKDRQVSGLSNMPEKPEGQQFRQDEFILGGSKTYTAVPYGTSVEVPYEFWEDELYGVVQEIAVEMGRAGRYREEVDAWSIITNSFDTAFPGFDGVPLCSTAHVGLDGVTRANRPATEIGFSISGIQASVLRSHGLTGEKGRPSLLHPTMAIVHYNNLFLAREILGSSGKPFSANNEINSLVPEEFSYMVGHFLTSTSAWWLSVGQGKHDLNFFWRTRPILDSFDDKRTKSAVFTLYQRHTKGFGSYRGVDGSTG